MRLIINRMVRNSLGKILLFFAKMSEHSKINTSDLSKKPKMRLRAIDRVSKFWKSITGLRLVYRQNVVNSI